AGKFAKVHRELLSAGADLPIAGVYHRTQQIDHFDLHVGCLGKGNVDVHQPGGRAGIQSHSQVGNGSFDAGGDLGHGRLQDVLVAMVLYECDECDVVQPGAPSVIVALRRIADRERVALGEGLRHTSFHVGDGDPVAVR